MSEWITSEAAAQKYGVKEELIFLWVELEKVPGTNKEGEDVMVNDKKLKEYLQNRKTREISADYVDNLELLCYQQAMRSDVYCGVVELLQRQIDQQQEKITSLEQMKVTIDAEIEKARVARETIVLNFNKSIRCHIISSITKVWKKCFPSKE